MFDEMELKLPENDTTSAHIELHEKFPAKQCQNDVLEVAPSEYNRILRKVDFRVIPILATLYLLSFLDRGKLHHPHSRMNVYSHDGLGSIGNAKIQGMATDLGLVGNQYNW